VSLWLVLLVVFCSSKSNYFTDHLNLSYLAKIKAEFQILNSIQLSHAYHMVHMAQIMPTCLNHFQQLSGVTKSFEKVRQLLRWFYFSLYIVTELLIMPEEFIFVVEEIVYKYT